MTLSLWIIAAIPVAISIGLFTLTRQPWWVCLIPLALELIAVAALYTLTIIGLLHVHR